MFHHTLKTATTVATIIALLANTGVPIHASLRQRPQVPTRDSRSIRELSEMTRPDRPPIERIVFVHFPNDESRNRRPERPSRDVSPRNRRDRRTRPRSTPTPLPTPTPTPAPTPSPPPAPSSTSSPTPTPAPTPTPTPASTPHSFSCPNPATCGEFALGFAWADPNGDDDRGIPYHVNTNDQSQFSDAQILRALDRSFQVWEQANTSDRLRYRFVGATDAQAGTQDFQNTFSFRDISREHRGALAVASVWFRTDTRELVEFDIVFNTGVDLAINPWPAGCSEYPIDTCIGADGSYDFENIAVHEIGHSVMLLDLSRLSQRELTMYGRARRGELKKRTLGLGDIIGLNTLYP